MSGMRLSKATTRKVDAAVKAWPGPAIKRQAWVEWAIDQAIEGTRIAETPPDP